MVLSQHVEDAHYCSCGVANDNSLPTITVITDAVGSFHQAERRVIQDFATIVAVIQYFTVVVSIQSLVWRSRLCHESCPAHLVRPRNAFYTKYHCCHPYVPIGQVQSPKT